MFTANCYNIMIASPGDVDEERRICREIIYDWNSIHSKKYRIILNPIGWEINSFPETGQHPQEVLKKQLLNEADILVGLFWNRLGTSTKEYASGTIEEITKHVDSGKPALLYFSNVEIRPDKIDMEQYKKLVEYKQAIKHASLYKEYSNISEFKDLFSKDLQLIVNDKLNGFGKDFSDESEKKSSEGNYSEAKKNAIEFVEKIPEFRLHQNLLEQYIQNLGVYRSKKLNRFFEEANLINTEARGDGMLFITIRSGFHSLSSEDIGFLLDDIKNGEYDHCF